MDNAAKIVRIVALLVVLVAAFVSFPYAGLLMVLLGLVSGFIGVPEERRMLYFIMAVTLATVAGALGPIPMVGEYLTAILTNLSTVINAGAVAVILVIVYERVTE
jgi:urease accessory protein UreF